MAKERKQTILLVEDIKEYREPIAERLRAEGYGVIERDSDLVMLEIKRGLAYDLALVDRSVKSVRNMGGDGVIKFSKEQNPGRPVIAMSSYSAGEVPYADEFLLKPIRTNKIGDKIREHLSAK